MSYISKGNINHNGIDYKKGDILKDLSALDIKSLLDAGVIIEKSEVETPEVTPPSVPDVSNIETPEVTPPSESEIDSSESL